MTDPPLGTATPSPVLDHVVINVRDRFDEGAGIYERLGFDLTPLGRHTLGSMNRLAVFDKDYLELLGIDPEAAALRVELLRTPMGLNGLGLNGLVFAAADADALHRDLAGRGAPVEPPLAFSRPVALAGGEAEARFRVVRVMPEVVPYGRVYFCQHLTPELVWRDEWRRHANGVHSIRRMVIAVPEPEEAAAPYRRLFGASALVPRVGGLTLVMGGARLDLLSPAEVATELGETPHQAGMAALTLVTSSLDAARHALAAGGVRPRIDETRRIVIPAASAFGVTLEFVEALRGG
jgi:catechol 2,3-dioxygenase-like lactoylglutathione lyase family enzyme